MTTDNFNALAQRLGCDAVFIAQDSFLGRAGDTISSRDICEVYSRNYKGADINKGADTNRASAIRWLFLALYFGISPFLFMDFHRITIVDQHMLIFTAYGFLYCVYNAWFFSLVIRYQKKKMPSDPIEGLETLFDTGVLQRRWNHRHHG